MTPKYSRKAKRFSIISQQEDKTFKCCRAIYYCAEDMVLKSSTSEFASKSSVEQDSQKAALPSSATHTKSSSSSARHYEQMQKYLQLCITQVRERLAYTNQRYSLKTHHCCTWKGKNKTGDQKEKQAPQETNFVHSIVYGLQYNHSRIREAISTSQNCTDLLTTLPELFL